MKKTLITAALALSTALAYGADYTTTTNGTGVGTGAYNGWCTALTHSYLSTSPEAFTASDILTLDSITLNGGNDLGGAGTLANGVKLAVFQYSGDNNVGSFVGISDNNAVRTGNSDFTFNFTGVELTADQQYQFLFVNTTATADTFTNLAPGATMLSTYQSVAGSVRHQVQNHASIPGGDGTYKGSGINDWEGQYVTNATYSLSTPVIPEPPTSEVIPEPATATLSLLALAGLAARRRRK